MVYSMRIGVFDSGIGGKAVAVKVRELLSNTEVISINDHNNMPYGTKPQSEVIELTKSAIKPLLDSNCDVIVLACNTATAVAIDELRKIHPDTPFIGIEPMVKPASNLTKTGNIAVLATPATLKSNRYLELKTNWAADLNVIEPDCSNWAELIETQRSEKIDVESVVRSLIKSNVDVIVLGCTHYHWIKDRVINIAGSDVRVLEPSDSIAERIKSLLP